MINAYDKSTKSNISISESDVYDTVKNNPNIIIEDKDYDAEDISGNPIKVRADDIYRHASENTFVDRPILYSPEDRLRKTYSSPLEQAKTLGEGVLDSAFLKKPLGKLLGNEKEQEARAFANPITATVGEIGGIVGQTLLTGGLSAGAKTGLATASKFLPASALAKGSEKLAENLIGKTIGKTAISEGTKANLLSRMAKEGSENVLFGLGYSGLHAIEKPVYTDQELNAESTLSELSHGALLDLAIGGAVPLGGTMLKTAYSAGKSTYDSIRKGAERVIDRTREAQKELKTALVPSVELSHRNIGQKEIEPIAYTLEEKTARDELINERKKAGKELPSYVNSHGEYVKLKDDGKNFIVNDGLVNAKADRNYLRNGEMLDVLDISDPDALAQTLEDNGLFLKETKYLPDGTPETINKPLTKKEIETHGVGNAILLRRKAEFEALDKSINDLDSNNETALNELMKADQSEELLAKVNSIKSFRELDDYQEIRDYSNKRIEPQLRKFKETESKINRIDERIKDTIERTAKIKGTKSDVLKQEVARSEELEKILNRERENLSSIDSREYADDIENGLTADTQKAIDLQEQQSKVDMLENELYDSKLLVKTFQKSDKYAQIEEFKKEMELKKSLLEEKRASMLSKYEDLRDVVNSEKLHTAIMEKELKKLKAEEIKGLIEESKLKAKSSIERADFIDSIIKKNHKWYKEQRHARNTEAERFWGAYSRYLEALDGKIIKNGDNIYIKRDQFDNLILDRHSTAFNKEAKGSKREASNSLFDFAGVTVAQRKKLIKKGEEYYERIASRLKSLFDEISDSGPADKTPKAIRALKYTINMNQGSEIWRIAHNKRLKIGRDLAEIVSKFTIRNPKSFIDISGIKNQLHSNLKKELSLGETILPINRTHYEKAVTDIDQIIDSLIILSDDSKIPLKTLWEFRQQLDNKIQWEKTPDQLASQHFLRKARAFIEDFIEKRMSYDIPSLADAYRGLKKEYQEFAEVQEIVNLAGIRQGTQMEETLRDVSRHKFISGSLLGITTGGPFGAVALGGLGLGIDSVSAYKMIHQMEQIDQTVKHKKLAEDAGKGIVLPKRVLQKSLTAINFQDQEEKKKYTKRILSKMDKYENPEQLIDKILETNPHLSMVDDEYTENISQKAVAINQYLNGLKTNNGGYERNISKYEMEIVAKKAYWALNPSENLRALKSGISSKEQIETLKKLYPATYRQVVSSAIEELSKKEVSNLEKMRIYSVLGVSNSPILDDIAGIKMLQEGQKEKQKALSQKMNSGNIKTQKTGAEMASSPLQ